MNAAIKLLDKYAEICKHASDSETARALKVRPSAVNNWRHERAKPDAESIERMCEATGEPLARWLPLIEAERAHSPGARRAWLRLAEVAAVLTLAVSAVPSHAQQRESAGFHAHNPSTLYIMSICRKLLGHVGIAVAWLLALLHGGTRNGTATHTLALAV